MPRRYRDLRLCGATQAVPCNKRSNEENREGTMARWGPDCRHGGASCCLGRAVSGLRFWPCFGPGPILIAASGRSTQSRPAQISRTESAQEMSVNNKRVFYVKYLANEIYVEILESAARRAARPAGERQSRCGRCADPVGGACLSGRRGARRARPAFPCRSGSAEAGAEPPDRVLATARASIPSMSRPARRRACSSSISPAATPIRSPSTRSACC